MKFNRCYGCMEPCEAYPCGRCGYDPEQAEHQEFVLRPGTILKGQYLVGRVLGQGGFGITYIGWDLALERKVAIKEYFPTGCAGRKTQTGEIQWYASEQAGAAKSSGREMFLKEARKMSKVSQVAQVVHVLDLFQENDTAYIIMDFIEGQTLKAKLTQTGPLDWEAAKAIFLPVIGSMEQVHRAGLVHRDLSPDNLMLLPDGSTKILDLGAAKDLELNSGASSMLVAKGGFSPIEQYTQRGGSGPWTDVYAMAATMYYTLTGKLPLPAIDRVEKDAIDWSLPQLEALPAPVLQAMQHAMALNPEDRTRTMEQFAQELMGKKIRQPRKKGMLFAGAAVVIAICGVLAWMFGSAEQKPALQAPAVETVQQTTAPAETEETQMTEPVTEPVQQEQPWKDNVLQQIPIAPNSERREIYGSNIQKYQVVSVTFLDSLDAAPATSWDVSEDADRSVLIWFSGDGKQYDLFIAADGGVNGVRACEGLFYDFVNLRKVTFNGNFHTEQTESFASMFYNCQSLQEIDIGTLDTAEAVNLNRMFYGCETLADLDLTGFDTAKVENMSGLFENCRALVNLQLGQMDTGNVTDMSSMFSGCRTLENLDLSSFDTAKVETMRTMFKDCLKLKEVDLSHFDTGAVTDYMGFMPVGYQVNGKPWKELFA